MSLVIYSEMPKDNFIYDIEAYFGPSCVEVNNYTRKCVSEIEHGNLISKDRFEDRFGGTLYVSEMSTGCKAAILVQSAKGKIINMMECGRNVLPFILVNNTSGGIYLPEYYGYMNRSGLYGSVDVIFQGKHFTDLNKLGLAINEG